MLTTTILIGILATFGLSAGGLFGWALTRRRVVPVNEVHIVQTRKSTISYGKGFEANTYYEWPSRLPLIGLQRVTLPVSNFSTDLPAYSAYDRGARLRARRHPSVWPVATGPR